MNRRTKIEDWASFDTSWRNATTEPEAIGLLYAGAKIKKSGHRTDGEFGAEDQARAFVSKVKFFLGITEDTEGPEIATTARRLIVNELLNESLGLSWTGLVGSAHANLLAFLGFVHDDLRGQPFPRKVNDFLFQTFYKWRAKEREMNAPERYRREVDLSRVSRFSNDYDRTESLVRACVAWGTLPSVLVNQWFTPEMLKEIQRVAEPLLIDSLGDEERLRVSRLRGSLTWAMNENPPRDLRSEDGKKTLWKLNGLTIHFLRSPL